MWNHGKIKSEKSDTGAEEADQRAGLIARNWYVVKETDEELHLVSKGIGRSRKVRKEIKSHDRKRV